MIARFAWQQVDGVLLLDKPAGISSNDALQKVRRLLRAAKGGHTGTLDPFATGLLPLCFGEATKFAGELLQADKRYRARVRLGVVTDSGDPTGLTLRTSPVDVARQQVVAALSAFCGSIEQLPPMHSALKHAGRPLYEYARAGIEVQRAKRQVTVHALSLLDWQGDDFELDIYCSKGFYVRTLASDLGERLGCGAHLAALRRMAIGTFDVADSVTLEALEMMSEEERRACLLPVDALLGDLPKASLSAADAHRLLQGQGIVWVVAPGQRYRLYDHLDRFIGLGIVSGDGLLQPKRMIAGRIDRAGAR